MSLLKSSLTCLLLLGQMVWLLTVAAPAATVSSTSAVQHLAMQSAHQSPSPCHQMEATAHETRVSTQSTRASQAMACCDEDQCLHLSCHGGSALLSQSISPATDLPTPELPSAGSEIPIYFTFPLDKPPKLS